MKFVRFYLPALLWMAAIFVFSTRQRVQVSEVFAVQFLFFKSLHILEYGMLFLLWFRALYNTLKPSAPIVVYAALISYIYAVSDEVHQSFVLTREPAVRDIAIDICGITIAAYFVWKLLPRLPRKLQQWASDWQLH